jgi:hypothetical protein
MDARIFDILDTAVKIGLGALISGVSTYWVTRLNYKNDAQKEADLRRHNTIAAAAGHVDEYLTAFIRLISSIDGVIRSNPGLKVLDLTQPSHKACYDFIRQSDQEFCKARDSSIFASSKLLLLGLNEVTLTLDELRNYSNEIRQLVMFEFHLPDKALIAEWRGKIDSRRLDFFNKLSRHYNS